MEMQSSKTEILGATKLDCIHMGTCVFLITRMDWIFCVEEKELGDKQELKKAKSTSKSKFVDSNTNKLIYVYYIKETYEST